ncbi:MAG: hypothetical protein IJV75_04235, partial [Alphaproteobacteria bacterium]|nr:hypothetical protein [Alphaproteobacteria bacterium]
RWIDTIADSNATDPSSIHWVEVTSTSGFVSDYKKNYFYKSDTMIPIRADAPVILVSEPYVEGEIVTLQFSELNFRFLGALNNVYCYNYDEDDFIADIAVVRMPHLGSIAKSLHNAGMLNQMAVVKEKAIVLDEELSEKTELTVKRGLLESKVYGDRYDFEFGADGQYDANGANNYSVDVGDIIVYGTNSKNGIHSDNMYVIYDCDENKFKTPFSSGMTAKQNFVHVSVYDKNDEYVVFANYNDDMSSIQDVSKSLILDMSKATIMKFDKDSQVLQNVKIGDIVSYKDALNQCSKGVLFTSYLDASHTYFIIYE